MAKPGISNKSPNLSSEVPPVKVPFKTTSENCILVSKRQQGNPLLKHIKLVPWRHQVDIKPDYVMSRTSCALFLSLRYHALHPDYIYNRLKELGQTYELQVLLVLVDSSDYVHCLSELSKTALFGGCSLVLAFSNEEAARYLETYKTYENKPIEALLGQQESDFESQMVACLTQSKSVNKPDAEKLTANFENLASLCELSADQLSMCPGMGPLKAKKLKGVLETPFAN